MAGKTSVYSMLAVAATLDGQTVIGLWDGDDPITVAPSTDVGTPVVGADGSSIFSQSADQSALITLRVQHTSATHRQLLQKLKAQRAGQLRGFPFDWKDTNSGEGGTTDFALISAAPEVQIGTNATTREWVLWTGNYEPNVTNA